MADGVAVGERRAEITGENARDPVPVLHDHGLVEVELLLERRDPVRRGVLPSTA
jgi:hypothetical protein